MVFYVESSEMATALRSLNQKVTLSNGVALSIQVKGFSIAYDRKWH